MKNNLTAVIMFLFATLAFSAFGQGKFPLIYEQASNTNMQIVSMTKLHLTVRPGKPTGLKAIPKGISETALYGSADFGIFALDLDAKPPKAYFDINKNSDISDDKPFEGVEDRNRFLFKDITLGNANFEANIWKQSNEQASVIINSKGCLTGDVKIGEKSYKVVFVDSTFDGKYNSTVVLPIAGRIGMGGKYDNMGFDFDGNGKIEYKYPIGEIFPLVKAIKIENDFYSIAVADDGSSVTMEKIKPGTGVFNVGSEDVEIMLFSEYGQMQLSGSTKYDLPEGQYQLMSAALKTKDKDGAEWTLTNLKGAVKSQSFEITSEKPYELKLGPPLVVKPDITQSGTGYVINAVVTGKGEETYLPGAAKNGRNEPAPSVTITDEKDNVLVKAVLQYG